MRALLILASACIATSPVSAQPSSVRIWQGTDPAITEGETVIDGDPADTYAAVLDYAKWTDIFPDVARVQVTSQQGIDARVTLIAPNGHRDNLHFHNQPAARLIFFEDTGNNGHAEVWGEIVFVAGDQPGTTRVHIRLFADVKGLATLVVSDGSVRKQRETKIERDLAHIHSYFRRP